MSTVTATQTNTYVYARHIAAKVSADLKRLQRLYGIDSPSDKEIDDYEEEMQKLLCAGYLGVVTYGYKRNNKWVVALKYEAIDGEVIGGDPGGISPEGDIRDSYFTSFLSYSSKWFYLPPVAKEQFKKDLPFQRVNGEEPLPERGHWVKGRSYAAGALGVRRSMIKVF
ncbi:hypothetical protein [Candidatus Spongiihabitans sp.]|uniref:HORMA-1 domain-containing protein n=1 Tax=Candidatus Spongiihabitans sp. TaxID=3101308 RepID=UPI003C70132F